MSKHWESATFVSILLCGLSADSSIVVCLMFGILSVFCFYMSRLWLGLEAHENAHAERNGSAQAESEHPSKCSAHHYNTEVAR